MPALHDRRRMGIALLCSLLLHAAWLLPAILSPTPRPGPRSPAENALVLTTRMPGPTNANSSEPPPETGRSQTPSATQTPADARGYYSAEQLTRPPRPLGVVNLNIPEAQLLTMPGAFILTLWIDAEGRVTSFQVDAPDFPEEYTTAVAEAFSAIRFSPGEILGRKVSSILRVEIRHDAASGVRP